MKRIINSIKKVYKYTKDYKKYLFFYIACIPFLSAISVIVPIYIAKELAMVNNSAYDLLKNAAIIVLLLNVSKSIFTYFSNQSLFTYFRESMKILKMKALKAVMSIQNKSLDEIPSGVIIERVNSDCNKMSNVIPVIVDDLLGIITNIGVVVTIFFINKILFLFLLVCSIIIFIFKSMRIKVWYKYDRLLRKQGEKVTSFITELIRGVRDIKVLNANESFLSEANKRIVTHNDLSFKGRRTIWRYDLLTGTIRAISNFLFIILSIYLFKNDSLTIAGFLAIFMYKDKVFGMFNFYTSLQETFEDFDLSSQRVFELIDGDTYERESFGSRILEKADGDFEFKHIKFGYKKNITVLKDVSFKVKANTTVAFVGKSGAGKTTIFGLLSKLYEPQSGHIYIDGIDINELDENSIRGNMTIINQSPYIFNMSIYDNMKLVNPKATKKEIREACKIACLEDFIASLPDKYNTIVGEGGVLLSGGQRQRLAIARALVQKTKIILFDEATSALDNETQKSIQDAINNMKGEYTILIIAHRFSTVVNSDKILYLEDGTIKAKGTHEELLKKSKGYKKLYELELKDK